MTKGGQVPEAFIVLPIDFPLMNAEAGLSRTLKLVARFRRGQTISGLAAPNGATSIDGDGL
jgi:hypothetical protein